MLYSKHSNFNFCRLHFVFTAELYANAIHIHCVHKALFWKLFQQFVLFKAFSSIQCFWGLFLRVNALSVTIIEQVFYIVSLLCFSRFIRKSRHHFLVEFNVFIVCFCMYFLCCLLKIDLNFVCSYALDLSAHMCSLSKFHRVVYKWGNGLLSWLPINFR